MDIVDCILEEHHQLRSLFAGLELARGDTDALGKLWHQLKDKLDRHAAAEEQFFYPALLECGHGAVDSDSAEETTEDAIEDHNAIAEAAEKADGLPIGSTEWWDAVDSANYHNSEHLAEEERQGLTDFRRNVSAERRAALAIEFQAFEAANPGGYDREKKDADDYIAEHQQG